MVVFSGRLGWVFPALRRLGCGGVSLVVPVHVFVYRLELVLFLFVDAVEAFRLPVCLGMVEAA